MTWPAGAALATVVLVTARAQAACNDVVAPASVEPTTFGTCTGTGPSETTMPTAPPGA